MARSLCAVPGLINGGSAHSRAGSETTEDQRSKHFRPRSLSAFLSSILHSTPAPPPPNIPAGGGRPRGGRQCASRQRVALCPKCCRTCCHLPGCSTSVLHEIDLHAHAFNILLSIALFHILEAKSALELCKIIPEARSERRSASGPLPAGMRRCNSTTPLSRPESSFFGVK